MDGALTGDLLVGTPAARWGRDPILKGDSLNSETSVMVVAVSAGPSDLLVGRLGTTGSLQRFVGRGLVGVNESGR
jgi:hypothetical protein